MKFELPMFMLLIALGIVTRKMDWRGQFFLFLLMSSWILYCWKKA